MPKENLDEPEDMDADSSAAPALDEAEAGKPAEGTAAESSAATDETEADSLSVVRDVVAERDEPAEAASSAEGEGEDTGADEGTDGQDDTEYTDVPFHKHPRFQHVLRRAKANEQDAGRFRDMVRFLETNNLESKEAVDVMEIAALAKYDPPAAWKRIQPWVQTLLVAAGEVLPQDLKERVEKNELTHAAALEVSRARAATNAAEGRRKFEGERGQRQQNADLGRSLMEASETWVVNRRLKDPNFAAKEDRLMEKIAFLQMKEGRPNTPDGVRAQLKKAYEAVNKEFKATPPASVPRTKPANQQPASASRPAIKPVQGGQVAANGAQAAPSSTLDVIRQTRQARSAA